MYENYKLDNEDPKENQQPKNDQVAEPREPMVTLVCADASDEQANQPLTKHQQGAVSMIPERMENFSHIGLKFLALTAFGYVMGVLAMIAILA